MIVQITPVASSKQSVSTTAPTKENGGGGLGNNRNNRKPICICNEKCKFQEIKQKNDFNVDVTKKLHGSLDQLLNAGDTTDEQKKLLEQIKQIEPGFRYERFYHQINGDIYEIIRKINPKEVGTSSLRRLQNALPTKRQQDHSGSQAGAKCSPQKFGKFILLKNCYFIEIHL